MTIRPNLRRGLAALALALLAGSWCPAASVTEDEELVILTHRDLQYALRDFLENDDRKAREKTFERLVLEVGSCLRGRLYEPAPESVRAATRKVGLEPVRRHPDFLNFMLSFAAEAPPHYDDLRLLCIEILADNCSADILQGMMVTVESIGPESVTYASLLPPLGRAVAVVEAMRPPSPASSPQPAPPGLRAAKKALEEALLSSKPDQRGGAISGMVEAGRLDLARAALLQEFERPSEDALLEVLVHCRRSLLRDDFGADLRERALTVARARTTSFLEEGPEGPIGGITGLSTEVLRFRDAYKLVRVLGGPEDQPMLLEAFTRDGAASLLGLDGLQRTRLWFQYRRDELDEAQRSEIDEALAAILLDTAERLFEAVEVPLDDAERGAYLDARDVRYNCAGYFLGLWSSEESIRALWCDNPDAVDFLEILATSTTEEHEGPPDDRWYLAMRDKRETLVQVRRLLAHVCVETDAWPAELDLAASFLETVCQEMSAEPEEYQAAFEQWTTTDSSRLCLLIDEVRRPADDFVKLVSLSGLKTLGFSSTIRQNGDVILERSAEGD